jgi:hypothetical protein
MGADRIKWLVGEGVMVECYRRNERDNWELVSTLSEVSDAALAEGSLVLDSVGLEITVPQIYEDVVFPEDNQVL